MSAPEGVAPGADAGTGMDSMSKEDLAPGSLAVSNSKVATEEGQRQERIDHAKLQHNKSNTWFLALTAIGIVYGDIGTSPLYAFSVALNATGHRPPLASDIIGIVSLTFWALLLMVSLKYMVFVLRADNDGEGGILALLALVASDKIADGARLSILVLLGVAGAALLYGDGLIVPVTLAILVALFAIQRRGTASIGRLFGPIMVIWFVTIAILGIVNVWNAPAILKALNPVEAVRVVAADPIASVAVTGAVFLVLTGGEALYADMGHVGAAAIRRAWFGLVLPALLLCYFGQGALVLVDPTAVENPFYSMAPGWALVPLIALATAATIIASQSLISGVFSLTRQAMQLGLCPRARIVPTSSDEAGQIYVPTANWMLMTGTLLIVLLFKTSDNLAGAYGIAVSGTMLATTLLLYRAAVVRWNWKPALAVPIVAFFGAIDLSFLAANALKIMDGGWFPVAVGGCVAILMLCWREGASAVRRRLDSMSMPVREFVDHIDEQVIGRAPGLGVWLTKVARGASPMLLHHVQHNSVMHRCVVLMTFLPDPRPRVPFAERHSVERLGHGFFHIQVRLGFMQTPDVPLTLRNCELLGFDVDFDHVHYYIGHEVVVRRPENSAMGQISFAIFAFLTRIASRAPDFFRIPHDGLSEVGFRLEI